ncbi:DinB family protein [Burkholderia ubonensis]|uniref:DinB family protein n=1 Tax=Burkholderia ubonensis TaxID=101571 RepID=UPI001E2E8FD1|nr:DinB family protein [Burkholderia ubonensis]
MLARLLAGVARQHRINLSIVLKFENTQGVSACLPPAAPDCSIRHHRSHRTARLGSRHLRVCLHRERACECPKSRVGQEATSAVWPSQTSDARRRHTGDFGHSPGMVFQNAGALQVLGDMVHTLNHVYVVDDIFRHHLQGKKHTYTSRNTDHTPAVSDLWKAVQEMDRWYIDLVDTWSDADLAKAVHFEFVGGGEGVMTREQIVLHVVNHATYHRGFVGDMMYQVPFAPPSNDLPVFIRGHYRDAR